MTSTPADVRVHRFSFREGGELLERFLALRDAIYADEYYYAPESAAERGLLEYYATRSDYRFELLLAESRRGVARVLVGSSTAYDFAFFGFFECANDRELFRALMSEACECARELGQAELRGPINLNALHGWCFLDSSEYAERWVGDPYHRAHHPQLFRAAGWQIADRCVSGTLIPAAQEALLAGRAAREQAVEELGIKLYRLGEVPQETVLQDAWRLVSQSFTPQSHRYVPVDFPVFRQQTAGLLAQLQDPGSLLLMYRGEECAGFVLSYANFIDRLCNPDGRKVAPGHSGPAAPFSLKTVAVAEPYRGRSVWKALLGLCAAHAAERYRHPFSWRRNNVLNREFTSIRENARITDSYATFRLGIEESTMNRFARIATYFRVMFPPHVNVPLLALLFYGFHAMAQAAGARPLGMEPGSFYGFATVVLSFLLMRLADELKDEGLDAEVFPDRPLVTGAVRYSDVRLLALIVTLLLLALNLGRGIATQFYFAWFVFFVLSWQWWMFPERVSRNVWLVFVTHQPLVPLLLAYAYAVYVQSSGAPFELRQLLSLCALYWIPMFSWEIARKVRAPEEETSYLTYTLRWGTRRAALIPPLCVALSCAATLAIGRALGFSLPFALLHVVGGGLAILAMLSFLWHPRRGALWVRTPMEAYLFLFCAAPLTQLGLERWATWLS